MIGLRAIRVARAARSGGEGGVTRDLLACRGTGKQAQNRGRVFERGDDFLDLVVKSVWQEQPVAVLLNDGHGNFIAVQPAAFPQIRWKSPSSQFLTVVPLTYPQAASLSRDRQEVRQGGYGWSNRPHAPGAPGSSNPTNPPYFELSPKLGRAPPILFP